MRILLIALMAALSGCATIIDGTSQQVMVNTNPSGADCGLYRQGERIATVQDTPGNALVQKTKNPIWIACVKSGYQPASYMDGSGLADASFGNIVAGGIIGAVVDSASGADNKYASPVNVSMVPLVPGQADVSGLPQTFMGSFPEPAVPAAPPLPAPVAAAAGSPAG